MSKKVASLERISKTYGKDNLTVKALDSVNLEIYKGDYLAVMGASGSGKSTAMNIIGCLDRPSEGIYKLNGCLLYTSPSPRDVEESRMPSSA